MSKLAKAREEFEFRNVWTVDGRICYIEVVTFRFLKHTTIKMFVMW